MDQSGPARAGRSRATTSRDRRRPRSPDPRGPARARHREPCGSTAIAIARATARKSGDGRVERTRPQSVGRHEAGQLMGGDEEHVVGHLASLGDDRAETQPGEDEDVVRLADDPTPPGPATSRLGPPAATRARPSVQARMSSGAPRRRRPGSTAAARSALGRGARLPGRGPRRRRPEQAVAPMRTVDAVTRATATGSPNSDGRQPGVQ